MEYLELAATHCAHGYIIGPGCELPVTTPPANLFAMAKATKDYAETKEWKNTRRARSGKRDSNAKRGSQLPFKPLLFTLSFYRRIGYDGPSMKPRSRPHLLDCFNNARKRRIHRLSQSELVLATSTSGPSDFLIVSDTHHS